MRCPYCGKENDSSAKNCVVCGIPLERAKLSPNNPGANRSGSNYNGTGARDIRKNAAPVRQTRPARPDPGAQNKQPVRRRRRRKWNKRFIISTTIMLLIVILIPILIAIAVHRGDTIESRRIQMFYSGNTGKTSIVLNGKVYDKTIPGKIERTSSSTDGLKQAALTEDGKLYYITAEKMDAVASGVLHYVLSADGSKLVYAVNSPEEESSSSEAQTKAETTTRKQNAKTDEETTESTTEYIPAGGQKYLDYAATSLFVYDGGASSSLVIANHVTPDSVCVSATGAAVGYTVTAEDSESFEGFVYFDGVSTSVGRNVLPIAVSDDALHSYKVKYDYLDEQWNLKLFAKNEDNEIKLDEFADGNMLSVYLNADCSEIIYSISGTKGSYFFCDESGEKQKIASGYKPLYTYGQREIVSGKAILTPYESFAKTVCVDATGYVHRIDGKFNSVNLGVAGKEFRLSPDGKTVYLQNADDELYSAAVRKQNSKIIADHVMSFELSPDGEYLYYVNTDNELRCVHGSKNEPVAQNVYTSNTVHLVVTDSGYLYFLQDYSFYSGTLSYLKDGKGVHTLTDINKVHDFAADKGDYIYFRNEFDQLKGTYNLYYGKGKKYTKLFEKMG